MPLIIDREFVTHQSFKIPECSRIFQLLKIRWLNIRGSAVQILFGLRIMIVACLRNATPTTAVISMT